MKLTPGSQKKGKAAKQAMDVLMRAPIPAAVTADDKLFDTGLKALMKATPEGDMVHIMCGSGVKVSLPAGAAKAINAARKKDGGK